MYYWTTRPRMTAIVTLILLISISVVPVVRADQGTGSSGSDDKGPGSKNVLTELAFGPSVYAVQRYVDRSGRGRLDMALGTGVSFSYIEGEKIIITSSKKHLDLQIMDNIVSIGYIRSCSSGDAECIAQAIRKGLPSLTRDDVASSLATIKQSLEGMKYGGAIGQVFESLVFGPAQPSVSN